MTAINSDMTSLDTCIASFLEANQSHATVWIQEDKTSIQRFSVKVPEKAQRTTEEAKKAFDTVLAMLDTYKSHITSDKVTHVQFLTALPQTFRKFHDVVDIKGLNEQIQLFLSASHTVLPHQQSLPAWPNPFHYITRQQQSLPAWFQEPVPASQRVVENDHQKLIESLTSDQPEQPRIRLDSSLLATSGAKIAYLALTEGERTVTYGGRTFTTPPGW